MASFVDEYTLTKESLARVLGTHHDQTALLVLSHAVHTHTPCTLSKYYRVCVSATLTSPDLQTSIRCQLSRACSLCCAWSAVSPVHHCLVPWRVGMYVQVVPASPTVRFSNTVADMATGGTTPKPNSSDTVTAAPSHGGDIDTSVPPDDDTPSDTVAAAPTQADGIDTSVPPGDVTDVPTSPTVRFSDTVAVIPTDITPEPERSDSRTVATALTHVDDVDDSLPPDDLTEVC